MKLEYMNWDKRCATCNFWGGKRDCDRFGTRVSVAGSEERGKCMIPKGGWRGLPTPPYLQCNDWKKWPLLKK